ncbi:MAG: YihY family inner membrane protein [Proteobacteria bacterium]|nr:YihY family inner membrane protein [Pseudomonadota bacterium]MDA0992484.1 YihY family inner membrane protein [Pseudomonadota bacterium]
MIARLYNELDKLIWSNRLTKAGLPGRILVVVLRYLYAMLRDFFSGQLTMRAMSLVYTTLLSVVPLLAFSFAILKGFGIFNELEPYLANLLAPLGDQGAQITEQILALVNNVKGSVLGGVGLAVFLYTAISTVQKVEESFNFVWYVSKPRSFARRFTEYLVVLLVGPLLMVTAIGILTSIQSGAVVQYILNNDALGPIVVLAGKLVPYILISGVFTFLYMFIPNTNVNFVSALVGGIAGGFMWATVGAIFTTFILFASRTLQIYAGFAVAITTLIWLYLNWLILLIGSQLAFYHQRPAFLRTGRQEPRLSNSMRERLALSVMSHIGTAFRNPGEKITAGEISDRIKIPSIALSPIINVLEDAGLIMPTEKENLLPGREMSRIKLTDILNVVRERGETGSHRDPNWSNHIDELGNALDIAVNNVLADRTLSDLLDEQEKG